MGFVCRVVWGRGVIVEALEEVTAFLSAVWAKGLRKCFFWLVDDVGESGL